MILEAMKQALEALEELDGWDTATQGDLVVCTDAIEPLRAAIEQTENAEPVSDYLAKLLDGEFSALEAVKAQARREALLEAAKLVREKIALRQSEGSPYRERAHDVVDELRRMAEEVKP